MSASSIVYKYPLTSNNNIQREQNSNAATNADVHDKKRNTHNHKSTMTMMAPELSSSSSHSQSSIELEVPVSSSSVNVNAEQNRRELPVSSSSVNVNVEQNRREPPARHVAPRVLCSYYLWQLFVVLAPLVILGLIAVIIIVPSGDLGQDAIALVAGFIFCLLWQGVCAVGMSGLEYFERNFSGERRAGIEERRKGSNQLITGFVLLIIMWAVSIPWAMAMEGWNFYHHSIVELRGATLADVIDPANAHVHAFYFRKQPELVLNQGYAWRVEPVSPSSGYRLAAEFYYCVPVVDGDNVHNPQSPFGTFVVTRTAVYDGEDWDAVAMRPNPANPDTFNAYDGCVRDLTSFWNMTDGLSRFHKSLSMLRNKNPDVKRQHYRRQFTAWSVTLAVLYVIYVLAVTPVWFPKAWNTAFIVAYSAFKICFLFLIVPLWTLVLWYVGSTHSVSIDNMSHLGGWLATLFVMFHFAACRAIEGSFPSVQSSEEECTPRQKCCQTGLCTAVMFIVGSAMFGYAIEGYHFYYHEVTLHEGVRLEDVGRFYGDKQSLLFEPGATLVLESQNFLDIYRYKDGAEFTDSYFWTAPLSNSSTTLSTSYSIWVVDKYDVFSGWHDEGTRPNPKDLTPYYHTVQQAIREKNLDMPKRVMLLRNKSGVEKRAHYAKQVDISLTLLVIATVLCWVNVRIALKSRLLH